jgi:4-amino-4-deoxy-L-arabinose transferase-like glycosyltransferase
MTKLCKLLFSVSIVIFVCLSIILHYNIASVPKYQDIDSQAYISNVLQFSHDPYYALGYSCFLSIIYKLFGENNGCVVWVQVLLSLLTMFFLFKATRNFFGELVALITVLFFSVNLGFLVFSQFILTEIVLIFLYVLFIERFSHFLKTGTLCSLICAGFVLGLSIAVKPAALYFIFPLGLLLFFVNDTLPKITLVCLLFFSFYFPVCGYMFFNKVMYGTFQVAPLANENLYLYLYPKVLAYKNGTHYDVEKENIARMLTGNKHEKSSWDHIRTHFYNDFKESPLIFIGIWLKNVLKTYLGLFTTNLKVLVEPQTKGGDISFFKTKGNVLKRMYDYITGGTDSIVIKIVGFMEAFWTVIRYLLCFIAFLFLFVRKKWSLLLFFSFYLFYFSIITGHDGCARFRMMFEPMLLSLAAFGLWNIIQCKTNIL